MLTDRTASALVIIDNLKGQVTDAVYRILQHHDVHVCLLTPNTTHHLQPMDISVITSFKAYLQNRFVQ